MILLKLIESKNINEVILATSSTVEGDATAIYIKDHVKTAKVSEFLMAFQLVAS